MLYNKENSVKTKDGYKNGKREEKAVRPAQTTIRLRFGFLWIQALL